MTFVKLSKKDIESLNRVFEHLADTDFDFFENCKCSRKIKDKRDQLLCKCKANKEHINRDVLNIHLLLQKIKNQPKRNGKRFRVGEITQESYDVIMHDIGCLNYPETKWNKDHIKLLKGNIRDIFGKTKTTEEKDEE